MVEHWRDRKNFIALAQLGPKGDMIMIDSTHLKANTS